MLLMREQHAFFNMRRTMVAGALGVILIALTTLLGCLYVFVYEPMLYELATSRLTETSVKVAAELHTLVDRVENIAELSRDWGLSGQLKMPETDGELAAFHDLYGAILREEGPGLSSVVTSDDQGREVLLYQNPSGGWSLRTVDTRWRRGKARFLEWPAPGKIFSETRPLDYVPSQRPWRREAALAGANEVRWTEPYVFRSTGELGISAVVRWPTSAGRYQYFASDLRLIDFSRLTRSIVAGKTGFTAALTLDGKVIGLPNDLPGQPPVADAPKALLTSRELGAPNLTRGLEAWERARKTEQLFSFYSGHERWLGLVRPAPLGNRRILVATFAPANDFTPSLAPYALAFVVVLAFTLLLSALIAVQFADRLARPLEQLAKISEKIGRLEFDAPIEVDSSVPEIRNLVNAQEAMRRHLEVAASQKRDGGL